MSSRIAQFFAIAVFIFLSTISSAQEINTIQLISFREEGRILLRWAPSNSSDWLELNEKGYTLERYTIIRDSTRVFPPEHVKLGDTIKPVPLSEWEKISFDNKYAAIAAQAIYGDNFQLQADQPSTDMINTLQLSKEQDLRYSFTILVADQSFEVASSAGLGFEDTNVEPNESYMYKLYGNLSGFESDTAYAIVNAENHPPLPKIQVFEAEFKDRKVMLRWRKDYFDEIYSSYIIEKSEDSINFRSINDIATITANVDKTTSLKWMMKSDSLIENEKFVYYRIRGKTPFGILGPYSRVISGSGLPEMNLSIGITDAVVKNAGIQINWDVKGDSKDRIVRYIIHRSPNSIGFVLLDSVAGGINQYVDLNPMAANYYKIGGINKSGDQIWSLPYFAQVEDSIPPIIPAGLTGICDSTGRVELRWHKNQENDSKGYRVFRSRFHDSEYRQVTVGATLDTIFYDLVNLETLSISMYYKVLAVDDRGNSSLLSKAVFVRLADIIPPVPPRITGYKMVGPGVEFSWTNSSSIDVISTKIFKIFADSTILINKISAAAEITSYTDSTSKGITSYFLTAIDSVGNESVKSNIIQLETRKSPVTNKITLTASADRKGGVINLAWSTDISDAGYRLYKAKNDQPLSLYKVFTGMEGVFADDLLEVNTKYHYRLQAIDRYGVISYFSNEIDILY